MLFKGSHKSVVKYLLFISEGQPLYCGEGHGILLFSGFLPGISMALAEFLPTKFKEMFFPTIKGKGVSTRKGAAVGKESVIQLIICSKSIFYMIRMTSSENVWTNLCTQDNKPIPRTYFQCTSDMVAHMDSQMAVPGPEFLSQINTTSIAFPTKYTENDVICQVSE